MTTRRELRAAREQEEARTVVPSNDDVNQSSAKPPATSSDSAAPARSRKRRSAIWITVGMLLLLALAGAWAGKTLLDRALTARDALESAVPLATAVREQILTGDVEGAEQNVSRILELSDNAREQVNGRLWTLAEAVPFLGQNFTAVRTAVEVVGDLAVNALRPAAGVSLDKLRPSEGSFDIAELEVLGDTMASIAMAVDEAANRLDGVHTDGLVEQVASGVNRLKDAVDEVQPLVQPANEILNILPRALGSEGQRNYLLVFQNNAESRGTGGNPAALVLLTAEAGGISITQQASSASFSNFRSAPVAPLDPETAALYGDKIGENVMDVTMTPDFTESAALFRAFWAEEFSSRIDAVVSFDPVALSYLLPVTGPITLAGGDVLTADNAVDLLLNEVYWRFRDHSPAQQNLLLDAYFGDAAARIFTQLTQSPGDPQGLITALSRAAEEGRLMYVPTDEAEAELVAGSRLSGALPTANEPLAVVGAYINDISRGKLDYYLGASIAASTRQCEHDAPMEFTTTMTLVNTLTPEEAEQLPWYISTGDFFAVGDISSDVVLYGPVGTTFVSSAVDGSTTESTALPHLGRPAVKVNVVNTPGQTRTISATFVASPDVAQGMGPLEIRHTPMIRPVDTSVEMSGCTQE